MRVKGNISPRPLDIEAKPGMVGYVCVRLRENIVEFTKTDDEGRTVHGYEYDEYEIVMKYYDGLQHDIESAFSDWLATGRTLEFNERATAACMLREALEVLGVNVNED